MSADLTIAEIERIRDGYSATGFFNDDAAYALIQHALAEPARLASAHTEGVREAIERCAAEAWRYAGFYPPHSDGRNTFAMLADCFDRWSGALSPPPEPTGGTAEPSAPVAPDWPTRCAALEADGIAARKRVAALEAENAKLRERNAALEDGLRPFAAAAGHALDAFGVGKSVTLAVLDRVAAYFVDWTHYRRARGLLQGGPDAG